MAQRGQAAEIKAVGIGKTFGAFRALKDLSLDVARGEFLTLLGPSGSGKTTFLMILAGFEKPSEGRLLMDGADITATSAEQRSYGMVFQGYALFPHMSVEQNIAFPLKVRRCSQGDIRRRVAEMIERVGLVGHEKKPPSQLSGGQQQRVALARALVFEPAVLLLDEPFSALDKNLRESMQTEVRRLHQETGTTFVFVTHDQSEALALSSRVAIFDHGALLQAGRPQDVYERPANRFVAEFLGQINLLPLTGVRVGPDGASGCFEDRLTRMRHVGPVDGSTALLAVRPEHMALSLEPPAERNGIRAVIRSAIYQGGSTKLGLVTASGVDVALSVPTDTMTAGLCRGSSVWVAWDPEHGFLLPGEAEAPQTTQTTGDCHESSLG